MRESGSLTDTSLTETWALADFLGWIQETLNHEFRGYGGHWVYGELSEWRQHNRHYYGELIEQSSGSRLPQARIRCHLWANLAFRVVPKFTRTAGEPIKAGMKVLFKVEVNFHRTFGLGLTIVDVDPHFTLGDREARKQQVLNNLRARNLLEANHQLPLPVDFTRVAVISSEQAAGLGDFLQEARALETAGLCQFDYYHAAMQGSDCPDSVARRLHEIHEAIHREQCFYDAAVIIRGGGSQADLDGFNHQAPAEGLCRMPVPVFAGIGHQRDETLMDTLACLAFDTPSKVIHYIARTIVNRAGTARQHCSEIGTTAANVLQQARKNLKHQYQSLLQQAGHLVSYQHNVIDSNRRQLYSLAVQQLAQAAYQCRQHYTQTMTQARNMLLNQRQLLSHHSTRLRDNSRHILSYARHNCEQCYQNILSLSITPTLTRGFACTYAREQYITSAAQARQLPGLTIMYHDGKLDVETSYEQ